MKMTVGIRNAMLDAIETTIGTGPVLTIYSGSAPASAGDAATGTALAAMTLPSDWLAAASNGSKALSGTWSDLSADATGTAGYARIVGNSNALQMTVSASGGGGEIVLSSTSIAAGQSVSITGFTLSAGNG